MMRVKIGGLLFVILLVVLVLACGTAPQTQKDPDIFASEDGRLVVSNQTAADLVLFAGRPEHGIVLGGIRAMSSRGFDITKVENLPEQGAFIVQAISAETYQIKKPMLLSADVLYTNFVAYNMKDTGKIYLEIPREIDETMTFAVMVSNMTRNVCLLRLDEPDGPVIAALSPGVRMKKIWLKPSGFGSTLLPVFVYSESGIINSISAKSRFRVISVSRDSDSPVLDIAQPDFSSLTYDYALVQVFNDTSSGIVLESGSMPLRSRTGTFFINPGNSMKYELHIPSNTGNPMIKMDTNLVLKTANEEVKIQATDFREGYEYTLIFTGFDGNYSYALREHGSIPAFSPGLIPFLLFE